MDWSPETGSLDLATLRELYASKTLTPADVVRAVYRRINRFDHVWISQVPQADALARAAAVERTGRGLPLYGIPFAVKDNIDVAGMPTTAACKEFARTPQGSATVVNRLTQSGAILIGKTNLDQFATGLVGVRSPYGPVHNPFDPRYVAGGSSSGSAVAVATGMVSFALASDTAGSGRVPAGFNNIVGLKPSRGILEQVEADPIVLNTNLGYYTNFVNLMDLCALALPCAFRETGVPFGITLIAPPLADGLLCALGSDYQARLGGRLGATRNVLPIRPGGP